jgi:hypothetical protein
MGAGPAFLNTRLIMAAQHQRNAGWKGGKADSASRQAIVEPSKRRGNLPTFVGVSKKLSPGVFSRRSKVLILRENVIEMGTIAHTRLVSSAGSPVL